MIALIADCGLWIADTGVSAENVGVIIGTIIVGLITGGVVTTKVSSLQRVKIDPPHLDITLREKYVSRNEFAEFKGEMKADVREMRGLFDKAVTLIDERDIRLSTHINRLAQTDHDARACIHEKVNPLAERIASIETRTDVSKSIGKLGNAIMAVATSKNQSPHV